MNAKQLLEAKSILYRIQKLDDEITKLERCVLDMINDKATFEISMHFKKDEEVKDGEIHVMEMNTIQQILMRDYGTYVGTSSSNKKEKEVNTFHVSEEIGLKMIQLYCNELVKHRSSLIIQLEKYNVEL